MKNQRGVAISGLLLWGFVIVLIALLGMKVAPEYMDYSKEGNAVVIAFSYEKRIPLFYNVSLLIDFHGSSSGN